MSSRSLGPTLIAIGVGIIAVPFLVMFFLAIGPLGWVLLGGAVIVLGTVVSLRESPGYDDVDRSSRINCDDCGARIDTNADTCEYCVLPGKPERRQTPLLSPPDSTTKGLSGPLESPPV